MTDALAVVAAGWGVLMAISPLLQIRRMLLRRSSADVSLAYLGVLQVGFALWVAYGITIGNVPLIVPNAVAWLVGIATLVIAIGFRERSSRSNSEPPALAGEAQHAAREDRQQTDDDQRDRPGEHEAEHRDHDAEENQRPRRKS